MRLLDLSYKPAVSSSSHTRNRTAAELHLLLHDQLLMKQSLLRSRWAQEKRGHQDRNCTAAPLARQRGPGPTEAVCTVQSLDPSSDRYQHPSRATPGIKVLLLFPLNESASPSTAKKPNAP
ncbi:Hypothetical predicted protein [Marmota monax]|uniref:Uncharacterized protein n=1 Tax=Marmota monax TaxID=9995 RepID=A0A5E4CE76_MARMO|nr:Hypothetical predicted protein [Marmota monax]